MEDLGDYVYVILIAVAGLSGLLKKKKEKPTTTPVEEDYTTVTKDVWKDFLPDNHEVLVAEPKDNFFDWETKQAKITSYENTEDLNAIRAKKSVEKSKSTVQKTPKKIVIEENTSELNIELSTVENARTAFIYAEIFNKKY